jgi:hypothetical protein
MLGEAAIMMKQIATYATMLEQKIQQLEQQIKVQEDKLKAFGSQPEITHPRVPE